MMDIQLFEKLRRVTEVAVRENKKWKKVHTGYSKGPSGRARKIYKYVSDDGKLEILSTTEHPTMGFAHQKKQIYWKVFDLVNQRPYGPPRRNLEDAFVAAEKWYKYIDGEELEERCMINYLNN